MQRLPINSSMWDNIHKEHFDGSIIYDNWLDNYIDIINKCNGIILDVGCGTGNDTKYLLEHNKKVISIDNSEYALNVIKQYLNGNILKHDITKPFPFKDNEIDLIIADLSLHYFDDLTTYKLINELRRILKNGHCILFRVNSIYDINHGAMKGKKLENHYYFVEGYNKRFFDEYDIMKYFKSFSNIDFILEEINRYKSKKVLYRGKIVK